MVPPPSLPELPAGALQQAQAQATAVLDPVWEVVRADLGTAVKVSPSVQVGGVTFDGIPVGVPTTVIPVPVAVTSPAPKPETLFFEKSLVLAMFVVAMFIWTLPLYCISSKFCCRSFQRWMSRRIRCYFFISLVVNITLLSCMLTALPDVTANDVFFEMVHVIEFFCDKLEELLTQLSIIAGVLIALAFRKRLVALLGFDQQLVRADLRDVLTCFTMSRFRGIEVSLWKAEDLPSTFSTRSLYVRVVLGYNEAQHTRPRDGCTASVMLRERVNLNYDPQDDTQQLSIVVKQQEFVGTAAAQFAPAVGALIGVVGGVATPLGPAAGGGLGMITGIGAANSIGIEVARADLSSAVINRFRDASSSRAAQEAKRSATMTGPAVPWREEYFQKVDLVPQGTFWLRIADLPDAGPV